MQSFHKVSKLCDYDGLSHKLLEGELHFTSLLAHIAWKRHIELDLKDVQDSNKWLAKS